MDKTGVQLLQLMFNPGETICVSPNKYGYHSIPLENVISFDKITLVSPDPERPFEEVSSELLTLAALNPIKGFRLDENCYAYRNFMLELDEHEIKAQVEYIRQLGIPYSAMIFSGGKSVHTLISLDRDLPSEAMYRLFSQWLLNVATLADQQVKNPSRSIRIPGGLRDGDKRQRLIDFRGKVKTDDLVAFLMKYEHVRPKPKEKRAPQGSADPNLLEPWVTKQLLEGIDFSQGRNRAWFSIACSFALAGYSEENTVGFLGQHFQEDRTFREKEWLRSIRSAFDYIHKS